MNENRQRGRNVRGIPTSFIFVSNPQCNLNVFNGFVVNGQMMFPILFVTIACGAVSGFHALVSSGTASKQIKNERNMLPISYGAMLMEK